MNALRNFVRCRRGSQMVEFALVAPVLLFLVLSIPVFAMVARSWLVISAAARDGARAASLFGVQDRAATAQRVAADSVYLERGSGTDVYFKGPDDVLVSSEDGNTMIVVTVVYRQPSYVPFLATLLNPSSKRMDSLIELRASARFRVEGT